MNDRGNYTVESSGEINLLDLWKVIWTGRWVIFCFSLLFAVLSVFYALKLPNMYKASTIVVASQSDNGGGLSGLQAQYGGVAAMAGISLGGGESSRIEQAVEVINSWPFLDMFVNKHQLKPLVTAIDSWDAKTNQIFFDEEVYDAAKLTWMVDSRGESLEPSSYESFKKLKQMIKATLDAKTGMLEIEVEHYSARLAFEWTQLLVQDINSYFQQKDITDARKNIEYLSNKVAETSISEMRSVFYNMIEAQTKVLMLAEVSDEYLVKTVVPPMQAEDKSRPKRAFICILGAMLGCMLGIFCVSVFEFKRRFNAVKK